MHTHKLLNNIIMNKKTRSSKTLFKGRRYLTFLEKNLKELRLFEEETDYPEFTIYNGKGVII